MPFATPALPTPDLPEHAPLRARGRRVTMLLAMIVLLSAADLAATITHLRTIGMVEANPIAYTIIQHTQSAFSLACYKGLTVLVCVLLLYRLRFVPQGEIAAWFGVLVLMLLTAYWGVYATHGHEPEVLATLGERLPHERWVTLRD
ncbi:MAG: hypothetical protein HRU76_04895 [Phycisphaeraceae bacterium]|nr:hypothetical protein [Phycisphaerales bacterium]QOJ16960.1 MAG: hypothetical protein HRU76_04895 [Phycisphaeraceae bacterium]